MSTLSQEQQFMFELHSMTDGNIEAQVSMYDVGSNLGLDKAAATALSQELIIEELVDLKTLSGGIGITPKGLDLLRSEGLIAGSAVQMAQLGKGPVIDDQDRQHLGGLLLEIRTTVFASQSAYTQLEELVIDLKTLDIQLISPRPKTAIVLAILESMQQSLEKLGSREIADRIGMLARR